MTDQKGNERVSDLDAEDYLTGAVDGATDDERLLAAALLDARAELARLEPVVEAARDALPHFKTTMGGQTARLILRAALARLDALPTHTEGGEKP